MNAFATALEGRTNKVLTRGGGVAPANSRTHLPAGCLRSLFETLIGDLLQLGDGQNAETDQKRKDLPATTGFVALASMPVPPPAPADLGPCLLPERTTAGQQGSGHPFSERQVSGLQIPVDQEKTGVQPPPSHGSRHEEPSRVELLPSPALEEALPAAKPVMTLQSLVTAPQAPSAKLWPENSETAATNALHFNQSNPQPSPGPRQAELPPAARLVGGFPESASVPDGSPSVAMSSISERPLTPAAEPAGRPRSPEIGAKPATLPLEMPPRAAHTEAKVELAFAARLTPLEYEAAAPASLPAAAKPVSTPHDGTAPVPAVEKPGAHKDSPGADTRAADAFIGAPRPLKRSPSDPEPVPPDSPATPERLVQPGPGPDIAPGGPEVAARQEPSAPPAGPHRTAPPAEPAAASPAPARDIRLQVNGVDQRVEVRVTERGGEVQVAVRTPDPLLTEALRSDLPSLSARLEQSGFRAETWHPSTMRTEQHGFTHEISPSGNPAQGRGAGRQGNAQDHQPPPRRPPVPDGKARPNSRPEFSRLFSSIR